MACNATRIELSNSAITTVQITISTWQSGDAELAVTLQVDGLGIDETATTSSGVASLAIAAVSASNNAIYDATLQVGANRPAVAEVLVTETNVAQTVGLAIDDTDVSYCAPTDGGAAWELLHGGQGQTLVVPSPIGRRIVMQQTYPDSTPDFRDGVDVMMNGSFDRASAGTSSPSARIARLNDSSYPVEHQWGADLATLIGWYDLDTDLDNCVVSDLVGTGVWCHYDVEYPYGMRDPVKLADDLLAVNDISTEVDELDYNGTSADEILLREQWELVCDGHLRRLMARKLLMPETPVGFYGLFSGDPKGQRAEMKLKYDMYKAFMERTVTDSYDGVTYTFKAADVIDAALPYCYGVLGDGFHWSSIWDSQTEQNLNLNRMTQEPYDVFRWYMPWLFTEIDCPLRVFPLLTYEQSRDDVAVGSAREAAGCPSGWTNAVLEAQVEFAAQSSGIVDRIPAFLYWCGDSGAGIGLNLTESKAMVENVAAIREGRYTGGFINFRAAIETDLTIQAIADADSLGRRISDGESGLLNPIPVVAPGSGTVTSVGLTVPGGFTVGGTNPITSSGTFDVTSTLSGVIKADGASTFSGSAELNDLADVNVSQGAGNDGDLVYWDYDPGAGSKFKGVARSSIALSEFNDDLDYAASVHTHALGDLSDVDIAGATTGQVLKFDGTDWVPAITSYTNDPTATTVRQFDDLVFHGVTATNQTIPTSVGTFGTNGWTWRSDYSSSQYDYQNDDAIGVIWAVEAGGYDRGTFYGPPSILRASPSDGDKCLFECRVKFIFNASATSAWVSVGFASTENANNNQSTFITPFYGGASRAGVYFQAGETYLRSFVYDNWNFADFPTKADITSVSNTNDTWYRIGAVCTYDAANTRWVVDSYVDGTLVATQYLTTWGPPPVYGIICYNYGEALENIYALDWVSAEYVRYQNPTLLHLEDV